MTLQLIDNIAVDWMKAAVQSYVKTMKQLLQNTFVELYPESLPGSSVPAVTSRDMVILMTALSSLIGLVISLGAVYSVYRMICWICVHQPTGGRSECHF